MDQVLALCIGIPVWAVQTEHVRAALGAHIAVFCVLIPLFKRTNSAAFELRAQAALAAVLLVAHSSETALAMAAASALSLLAWPLVYPEG